MFKQTSIARLLGATTLISMLVAGITGCGSRSLAPLAPRGMMPQSALRSMGAPVRFRSQNAELAGAEGYYLAADGQQGQALLESLNRIAAPHQNLGYDQGRDIMFGQVDDLDDNDVVNCVYTQKALPGVFDRGSAYQGGRGLNAEHTWPKSQGAEQEPAKADLHHLFPTDVDTNSKRSSFPFGEVVRVEYENQGSKLGRDANGRTVFEPRDDHKGNVARALFYFYTVYGRQRGTSLSNFRVEEPVLHKWHQMDPVDGAERARNDAIFRFQKNRNPYIDHPEYVAQVGRFLP